MYDIQHCRIMDRHYLSLASQMTHLATRLDKLPSVWILIFFRFTRVAVDRTKYKSCCFPSYFFSQREMCQLVVPGRKKKEINGDDCQNTRRRPSANKRKRLEEAEMKVETAVATIITVKIEFFFFRDSERCPSRIINCHSTRTLLQH